MILISDALETKQPEATQAPAPEPNTANDLDKLLSGYSTPLNVNGLNGNQPQPPQQPVTPPVIEYYKTGKKAGQQKPPKKVSVTFTPPPNMQVTGELISGALFVTLFDMLVPMLVSMLNNFVSKTKIDFADLQLTAKQKDQLAPVADKIVKQLKIDANPLLIGSIAYIGITGINLMAARQLAELKAKEAKRKEQEKNQNNYAAN
jgi:hypothetical protein